MLHLRVALGFIVLTLLACNGDDPFTDADAGADADVADSRVESDASVTKGDKDTLLLRGTVVTPDKIIDPGEVLTYQDTILCVASSCAADPKAAKATIVNTGGIIFPGLIDAHNHTQYNYLPLWKHTKMYTNHGQWQADSAYKAAVSAPHNIMKSSSGLNLYCEMIKYGEIRSLVAGTTTIQGTTLRKCADTLIRNADLPYHGFAEGDTMRTNVLGVGQISTADATKLLTDFTSGKTRSYVIHLSEGTDETARKEFDQLEALGLLKPQVVVVHGTALGQTELTKLKQANMPMIWSPSSNLDLYGGTNDIVAMKKLGLKIAVAPDWTPSGEPNMLDELRAVDTLSKTKLSNLFSAKEIVAMGTSDAAASIKFDKEIGKLEKDMRADVLVISGGDPKKPHESLLQARLPQVRLVLAGGVPLYGDPGLMTALSPNTYCESVQICNTAKTICVKESDDSTNKLNQSLGDIETELGKGYPPGILTLSTNCK
jgi:5-methylthioadenosine/S-adenosylhomocysteine deaminase